MKNLTTFVLLLILCCNLSIAQNIDTTFKVTYKNNKILINNQSPYNLWLINQRDYIFDISDTSLTGQIISLSFANDANQNGIPNISAYYQKTGKEGESKANIKVNIPLTDINPSPISIIYLYNEKVSNAGNKIYFSNYNNLNISFFNNRMYFKYNITKQFDNKIGESLNKNLPFSGNEEIGLYMDLNNDKNLDLVFATDQLYHKGDKFNTGKLMVPIYYTIKHNKEQENPLTIDISNEDLSKPNSTPKTLLHNWDIKTEIDLDGDNIKEYINWGEHYHVGLNPLWKDVATQLGMTRDVDYGDARGNYTFYDSVFYLRRFRYYKVGENKLLDKKEMIPAYNALTGSFFGAAGDVDKDGDNDMVLKSNRGIGITLYNDGKGIFNTSKDLAQIPRIYFNESFNRSDAYHYPYLIDMNNDGYPDWIVSLSAPNQTTPIRIVYYPNKNGVIDIENPVDIFPYNSQYGKDNFLSYGIIQVKHADLDKDGNVEMIFLLATGSNQDYLRILPRNIFKIISITKSGIIDVTSNYFLNNQNIVETGNAMKGFNIIDINNDGQIDLVPRFEMYNPKYSSWFPTGSWRGYWNNNTDFQYFEFNGKNYDIKSAGKFITFISKSNNSTPNGLEEGEGLTNMVEVIDLNNDKIPEYFYFFQSEGILNKSINDFSIGVKKIDAKENTQKGTYLTSLNIEGYDTTQIEYSILEPLKDTSIIIKNKNQIFLNQSLSGSSSNSFSTLVKYVHKTLNISGLGYVKLNIIASLPEKPKIVSLNGDTSQSIKLCSVIPGSVRVKVDSTETIQKFTAEVSIDSLFTNIKSFESTNSAVTVDISNTGRYFTRVKTSNKNGSSPYSETKSFTISQIPTAPSLSRDTENNLIANSNGITWFKDGVKTSDTSQKFKPTSNGFFTATTTQNGCTSAVSANYYYLTSAVTNLSSNEYFKVSPNPTNGDIYVNYNITSTNDIYISIIDMSGRTINTNRKVNNGSKINFGSAMKGSYIIQVKDKSGRILTTEKIVKN
jgi:hypothetical protein